MRALILILLISTTAISQDQRQISYDRLKEFAKLLEHKKQTDSIFIQYRVEMLLKDSIIANRGLIIKQYEAEVVPSYQNRIRLKDSTIQTTNQIFNIKETYYKDEVKRQKRKKWVWVGTGALIGLVFGVVVSN